MAQNITTKQQNFVTNLASAIVDLLTANGELLEPLRIAKRIPVERERLRDRRQPGRQQHHRRGTQRDAQRPAIHLRRRPQRRRRRRGRRASHHQRQHRPARGPEELSVGLPPARKRRGLMLESGTGRILLEGPISYFLPYE